MSTNRYPTSQILSGLREIIADAIGSDTPLDADASLYRYLVTERAWDDLDFADVIFRIERRFAFKCSREQWRECLRADVPVGPNWERDGFPSVTLRHFADFVREHAVAVSFEPITVWGRTSAAAGVFVGIEEIADHVLNARWWFAPSARIHEVFRGNELQDLWNQLAWRNDVRMPKLSAFWQNIAFYTGAALFLVLAASPFLGKATGPIWPAAIVAVAFFAHGLALLYRRFVNPLPRDCITFRDLARWIAEHRQAVAS